MESKDSQVRKDLSYFGKLGKRGLGYETVILRDKIADILGIKKEKKVCIIGMGNLGSALAAYKGFESLGFKIAAVFDNSDKKIGQKIKGHVCQEIKSLSKVVKDEKIDIAILTIPAEAVQETAQLIENSGIKAILNFTPVKLSFPKNIKVSNADLALELKTLSFFIEE